MSKAATKPAKKGFADFDMDAMDFSAVPANTEFKAAGRFQRLPLADIDPDPMQVRREFDQIEIDALAATIKERGLLQPIVVAPTSNGRYIIRYGERRYRACRQLGFDQIDTVLDQADAERDIGLDQFLENEQRQALSLAERVHFIAARVSDDVSTKDLAEQIAKPHSEVKRLYSLRTLPDDILAALAGCSPRAAVAIKHAIELDEQAARNFLAVNESPTAAACEQFLAALQGGPEGEGETAPETVVVAPTSQPRDEQRLPVAAATNSPYERNASPEPDVREEGEGQASDEPAAHKHRAPRQPKEANDAPAIIFQGRRGIILSGQVTVQFDGEAAPQTFNL